MYCWRCGKEPQGNPCTTCGARDPLGWLSDLRDKVALSGSVDATFNGGGPHTHPESEVTNLTADLGEKADADHSHVEGGHPDLATHDALGLATDAELSTHAATAHGTTSHAISGVLHSGSLDHAALGTVTPNQHHNQAHALGGADHSGALAQSSITNLVSDLAAKAEADHTHPAGNSWEFPVGHILISADNVNPATWLGYGTWAQWGAGRFLLGATATGETQAGSATHAHTFTQPSDHAALTHAGATVGNHAFTQPGAHSDHAAQAHSAHAGATVGNHTDVLNHVHTENINTATTGGVVGFPALKDTSTSGSEATGLVTSNPTANGVAAQVHTVGQASAHSDHAALSHSAHSGGAVDAHTVGQANNHAAQSHAGGAVTNGNTDPLSITAFLFKRTA